VRREDERALPTTKRNSTKQTRGLPESNERAASARQRRETTTDSDGAPRSDEEDVSGSIGASNYALQVLTGQTAH